MLILLTWIVAVISLIATVLNIQKKTICFYMWCGTNSFWAIHNYQIGEYAQSVIFTVYTALAIYGVYQWRKADKNKENKQ